MSVLEKNSPPVIQPEQPTLEDVRVYVTRTGVAEEAGQALDLKHTLENFTNRHDVAQLNRDTKSRLGDIAISSLSALSRSEFMIPTKEN